MLSLLRRCLIGFLGAGLGLALMTSVGRTDEVAARASATGIVVHGPEETLREHCAVEDGTLWLQLPGGARFELATETSEFENPGDGSFHPFDEAVVRNALASVRYPTRGVSADVYLLPYPRRSGTRSAAGPQLILLSPGVVPLSEEHQHATLVHELGHVVQYQFMPDDAAQLWERYRELRGLADEDRYCAEGAHADRPHEIFAEDFRALFGGGLATYSGTIENASLSHPALVTGLDAFLISLESGTSIALDPLRAFPNPARGAMSFRRGGESAAPIDLFDVSGRRVASLTPTPLAEGWQWRWDGRDDQGNTPASGVVFARERGSAAKPVKVVLSR